MIVAFSSMKEKEDIEKEVVRDFSMLKELKVNEIENIGIFNEIFLPENFLDFVNKMEKGEITLNHQSILLRQGYESHGITECLRTIPFEEYKRYPVANYELYGSSVEIPRELYEKLEWLGLFHGIDEIASIWLKMRSIAGYAINAIVVLPIYFEFKTFGISDNEFSLSWKVHKYLYPKLEVLFELRERFYEISKAVDIELIKFDEISCRPAGSEFLECETKHKFNTFLNLEDEIYFCIRSDKLGTFFHERMLVKDVIKKTEFKEPFMNFSTKFITLETVENLLEGKQRLLKKKKDPSIEFQLLISYLLSLLNMKVMDIGATLFETVKRKDGTTIGGIDIIAQDIQSQKLYVIQCSISTSKILEDISLLANICHELRKDGFQVEPLIIVRDFVTPEIKENKSRIKVIDREDLLKILQLLKMENINEARRILLGF